jgi:hypothetical protein
MSASDSNPAKAPARDDESRSWILGCRRLFTPLVANPRTVLRALYAACAVFLLLELVFVFHWADKDVHYGWEQMVGFQAAVGFLTCVVMVIVAKVAVRPLVSRDEDYYEPKPRRRD